MPDCKDCEIYKEYSGHQAELREVTKFKDKMTAPGNGTIDRLWTAVEDRATKGMMIFFTVAIIGLVGTLFGLVYRSNDQILRQFVDVKTDIAAIKEQVRK